MQQGTFPPSMVIARVAGPEGKVVAVAQKASSLARTKWLREYHIVFAPKHGRKATYDQYRKDLGEVLWSLRQWKGVETVEGRLMTDHARTPAGIPPETGASSLMGCLRGRSPLPVFDRHANLEHEFGNRKFWAEGRCVSAVGPDEATIAKHARERERADIAPGRLSVKEYEDPFARGPQGRWARRF